MVSREPYTIRYFTAPCWYHKFSANGDLDGSVWLSGSSNRCNDITYCGKLVESQLAHPLK